MLSPLICLHLNGSLCRSFCQKTSAKVASLGSLVLAGLAVSCASSFVLSFASLPLLLGDLLNSGVCTRIESFPVYHGGTYVSLGFVVGRQETLLYISDVTSIPQNVMRRLKQIPNLEVRRQIQFWLFFSPFSRSLLPFFS